MNRFFGELCTDVYGVNVDHAKIGHIFISEAEAIAADTDGIHVAIAGTDKAQTITTDISNPPYPRNITLDIGGTAGDVKAGDIVVYGTNICDELISETFTLVDDTDTDQVGDLAFKTVNKIVIPAQDGTGATFTFGFGDKLGLPFKLDRNTVILTMHNKTAESNAPTVAVDADEIEKNTIDLNTALNGKEVDVFLIL